VIPPKSADDEAVERAPHLLVWGLLAVSIGCGGGATMQTGTAGTMGGGSAGSSGAAGTTGAGGTHAAAGTTGAAGTKAAAGTSGAAGTSVTAGTTGSAGTSAAAGTSGAAGARGPFDLSRVDCLVKGDGKTSVALVNHCRAHVTFAGSQNQKGELEPEQFACRDVGTATANLPAIRYWGFTAPDPGLGRHTLAEFTFNTTFNDFDWYNISHVDATNLPMQIVAREMPNCRTLTCAQSLLPGCPAVGQYKDASGTVTACVSPMPDAPQSVVAKYFEQGCADAYSWSGDDAGSVVACAGEDYVIVFCP
jgi:hypothetical protein